jgi:hypothetical protein
MFTARKAGASSEKEACQMKKVLWIVTALFSLALIAWAADPTGKWTAQVPGRGGNMREVTFNFKAEGQNLTGTMSGRQGDIQISDGKINGDDISFTVTQEFGGNTVKQNFSGKITGGEIKMKREGGQGGPIEFVAKKPTS